MSRNVLKFLALLFALMMVAAACGSDDDDASGETETTEATETETTEAEEEAEAEETTTTEAMEEPPDEMVAAFDANGDGSITIGVAAAGPANDGAYYQAVVDAATQVSIDNGFNDPIVVDEIEAADAATALSDLAAQVDIVIVGASEIAEPLGDLTEEYADVFWYCNCGAGFPETPGLAQSLDDGSEIWRRELGESNSTPPFYGYSTSPVTFADLVILATGGDGAPDGRRRGHRRQLHRLLRARLRKRVLPRLRIRSHQHEC